jgi:hypothetical protein
MKLKITILLLAIFAIFKTTNAQEVYASTMKIGPFSLDMKDADVNKICANKISKTQFKNSAENFEKKVKVTINGIVYKLGFYNNYDKESNLDGTFNLVRVESTDDKIKTKSGIAIGMDKFEVFKKLDGMNISYLFNKFFKYDDDGNPTNKFSEYIEIRDSKTYSTLTLEIENGKISGYVLEFAQDGC